MKKIILFTLSLFLLSAAQASAINLDKIVSAVDSAQKDSGGKSGSPIDNIENKLNSKVDKVFGKVEERIDQVSGRIEQRVGKYEKKFDEYEAKIDKAEKVADRIISTVNSMDIAKYVMLAKYAIIAIAAIFVLSFVLIITMFFQLCAIKKSLKK